MPNITVNLYATLRQHIDGQPSIEVPLNEGQTIEQLVDELGVPLAEIRMILCDNRLVQPTHRLHGGETLGIFPAVGGG